MRPAISGGPAKKPARIPGSPVIFVRERRTTESLLPGPGEYGRTIVEKVLEGFVRQEGPPRRPDPAGKIEKPGGRKLLSRRIYGIDENQQVSRTDQPARPVEVDPPSQGEAAGEPKIEAGRNPQDREAHRLRRPSVLRKDRLRKKKAPKGGRPQ
jgi:hypothetical protein